MPRYDNVIVKVVKRDMTTNEKVKLCEKRSDFRLVKNVFLIMYIIQSLLMVNLLEICQLSQSYLYTLHLTIFFYDLKMGL